MKANEVMTATVESCGPATDLAAAAMIMWRNDCGSVPVLAEDSRRVVGMITDRDICMAVATKHRAACDIAVGDVMSSSVVSCRDDDDVREVLKRMREHQVRRLPVLSGSGELQGVVAINDVILSADAWRSGQSGQSGSGLTGDLLATLQAICGHPRGEKDLIAGSRGTASKSRKRAEPALTGARAQSGRQDDLEERR